MVCAPIVWLVLINLERWAACKAIALAAILLWGQTKQKRKKNQQSGGKRPRKWNGNKLGIRWTNSQNGTHPTMMTIQSICFTHSPKKREEKLTKTTCDVIIDKTEKFN